MKIKDQYRRIASKYLGRILIVSYNGKSLTFTPIPDEPSALGCSCGCSAYNATNFGNVIHFCPEREIECEVTDYVAISKPAKV